MAMGFLWLAISMPADPACRDESLDGQHCVDVPNEALLSSIARCAGLVFLVLVYIVRGGDEDASQLKPRLDGVSITSRRPRLTCWRYGLRLRGSSIREGRA